MRRNIESATGECQTESIAGSESLIQDANGLLYLHLRQYGLTHRFALIDPGYEAKSAHLETLRERGLPYASLEDVIFSFEKLLSPEDKSRNGITFTPKNVCDTMVRLAMGKLQGDLTHVRVLDPCCGGGMFLLATARHLQRQTGRKLSDILRMNVFGLELVRENAELTRKALLAACLVEEQEVEDVAVHIHCKDALKCDWSSEFQGAFDLIIGNPPYVNPHDLPKEVAAFLKRQFSTTSVGTTNIFYAFIEHGMSFLSTGGKICYIVPNNFISISASRGLRHFLVDNSYLELLVDFTDNMLFAPIRTYNAIILLGLGNRGHLDYVRVPRQEQLMELDNLLGRQATRVSYSLLDHDHRWVLSTKEEREIIECIEGQFLSIKACIRTGIATLRDDCYLIDQVENGRYYKLIDGTRYEIEAALLKPIYKISEIDASRPLAASRRYIIFPYVQVAGQRCRLLEETEFRQLYPGGYASLKAQKASLDSRDRGKPNAVGWYAYGRTQGLNFHGDKIFYPTFSALPKFQVAHDDAALFCNGYAIFEHEQLPLDILCKILNSSIMDFYVKHTSYPIEGGYMCYQKKYIERFSVPFLNEKEKEYLRAENNREGIDCFLVDKYGIAKDILQGFLMKRS